LVEQSDDVMTLEERAAYLRLPKSTLYKQVREGKIPGQKIGQKAIDRWINEEHKGD